MILVNGQSTEVINVLDRGLAYGDGVFRTLRIEAGRPLLWQRHYAKLRHDCEALAIPCPAADLLYSELEQLGKAQPYGVAKIIVTRGVTVRGYAPVQPGKPNRILSVSALPTYPKAYEQGIAVHLCRLRLAQQPRLAGIKHLNRLENVLAASECQELGFAEGILCDQEGWVISGTRSNLFAVKDGKLLTPDLARCGIAGVQRDRVLDWASRHSVSCKIGDIGLEALQQADEIFLVNSLFGLWPVSELGSFRAYHHPWSLRIREWLSDETH